MSSRIIVGIGGSGIEIGRNVLRCFEQTSGSTKPLLLAVDADLIGMREIPRQNQYYLGGVDLELKTRSFDKPSFPHDEFTPGWRAGVRMGSAAIPEMGHLAFRAHESALRKWLSPFIKHAEISRDTIQVLVFGSLVGGTGSGVMPPIGGVIRDLIQESHTGGWVLGLALESYAFTPVVQPELHRYLRQNQQRSMSWLTKELSDVDGKNGYDAFYTVSASNEVDWREAHRRLARRIVNTWENAGNDANSPAMFENANDESLLLSFADRDEPQFTVLWGPGSSVLRQESSSTAREFGIFFKVPRLAHKWAEPIEAFRALVRDPQVREADIQRFLEHYPFFLTGVDYERAVPQVHLDVRDERGLIPDFMLVPFDNEFADIVELKLPDRNLVVDVDNHPRFSAAVTSGLAQLRDYESYFDDGDNRRRLSEKFGFTAFKPKLSLIIGQASLLPSSFVFRKVCSDSARVTIYTYDEIIARAERLLEIRSAGGPRIR